jgi:transcriptional regulator GlxA family with amidase domain
VATHPSESGDPWRGAGDRWATLYAGLHAAQAAPAPTHAPTARAWRPPAVAPERRARDVVDREHARPLALAELAAAAGVSRHHLVRRFAAAYGQTPGRYLTARRLERASALLRTTELPVTEVCHAVGFASLGSFGRAFRAAFGTSPREHRRTALPPVPGCFAFMRGVRDRATSE